MTSSWPGALKSVFGILVCTAFMVWLVAGTYSEHHRRKELLLEEKHHAALVAAVEGMAETCGAPCVPCAPPEVTVRVISSEGAKAK